MQIALGSSEAITREGGLVLKPIPSCAPSPGIVPSSCSVKRNDGPAASGAGAGATVISGDEEAAGISMPNGSTEATRGETGVCSTLASASATTCLEVDSFGVGPVLCVPRSWPSHQSAPTPVEWLAGTAVAAFFFFYVVRRRQPGEAVEGRSSPPVGQREPPRFE